METTWLERRPTTADDTTADPINALLNIAYTKTSVQVEVENTLIRFNSLVSVSHNGTVMLSKPFMLGGRLIAGNFVRVRLPGTQRAELRLEVQVSHFNLPSGKVAFLCKGPAQLIKCRRKAQRHYTARYTNVRLVMGGDTYRLVDLSTGGFKVFLNDTQSPVLFPIGEELKSCQLILSPEKRVDLLRVVPRNHQRCFVGCEYEINFNFKSQRNYQDLMGIITRMEPARISGVQEGT
jgi:hypothetical protein